MAAIFISHRSSDNAEAMALRSWLAEQGHEQLFLDFDPADGIPPGVDWEQRLYRELRRCQALLIVLSPAWRASMWCQNELAIAREKGKAIFVVRVKPHTDGPVIPAIQELDLTMDREGGLVKLARGLREHGLDPAGTFDWKPGRPIYPGLAAFDVDDAAIFFGRSEESWQAIETLRHMRLQAAGSPKLLLVTGASGSGKSSLMRAGVLARLRKESASWIVARPFRCGSGAVNALAEALAWAFPSSQRPPSIEAVTARLQDRNGPVEMLSVARELRFSLDRPEATIVLALDQAEELFTSAHPDDTAQLIDLFRETLTRIGSEILVLATIRSDSLTEWQQHASIKATVEHGELPFEILPLGPMPMTRIPEIIRGPAAYEDLHIEDELVDAIRADTAKPDALPLLAYTLQHLHRHFAKEGRLRLIDYRSFGGLEGSVRSQADLAVPIDKLSVEDLGALQEAFVPGLVRATADGGFSRSRARLGALPRRSEPYLRRMIDHARLLKTDVDALGNVIVEVAHEALLRVWPPLERWIAEDAESLRRLEAMQHAAGDWGRSGRQDDFLVHRDQRLIDAETLIATRHFCSALGDVERDYLARCRTAQVKRARETREARDRELAQLASAQVAQSRFLAERARQTLAAGEPVHAALLGLAGLPGPDSALDRPVVREAEHVTWEACQNIRERLVLREDQEVLTARFSPNGALVLTVTSAGLATLWDAKNGQLIRRFGEWDHSCRAAMFSPDGSSILSVHDGAVYLQDARSGDIKYTCRPEGYVHTAVFSQDGSRLVMLTGVTALDFGGDVRSTLLFDGQTGRLIARLEGHTEIVWTALFSRDGRYLATTSFDKTARLWNAQTGAALATLRGHRDQIRAAAFSPDGELLATGADDKTIQLWKVATGKSLTVLRGSQAEVRNLSFSPDGAYIIACAGLSSLSFSGATPVWDICTGGQVKSLETQGLASNAEFSCDGFRLVTVTTHALGESRVHLWNAKTWGAVAALKGHTGQIYGATFSADGRRVVTASEDRTARIWDVYSGAHRTVFPGHTDPFLRPVISYKGRRVLTISRSEIRLWDLENASPVGLVQRTLEVAATTNAKSDLKRFLPRQIRSWVGGNSEQIWKLLPQSALYALSTCAEFSPDGTALLTTSFPFASAASLWDGITGSKRAELRGQNSYVLSAAFSPDGAHVVTTDMGGQGQLWNAHTGGLERNLVGHDGAVLLSVFSPDGRSVVTSSVDKTARIWHVASGKEIAQIAGHLDIIQGLAFSPDGERIITASADYTARLWDAKSGAEIANLSKREAAPWSANRFVFRCSFAISQTELLVVGDSASPIVRVYCTKDGHLISELRGHQRNARIERVRFSCDGSLIVTTSDDHTARIWDANTGQELMVLIGHLATVTDAAFTNKRSNLVTTSKDGTVRLWNAASGEEIVVMTGHEGPVSTVTFSNDEAYFVTTSEDGTLRTWTPNWEWQTADVVAAARAKVSRSLTTEERRQAFLE
jgi:WD40 repeat protein